MNIEKHLFWAVPLFITTLGMFANFLVTRKQHKQTLAQTKEHHKQNLVQTSKHNRTTYKTLEQNRITDLVIQERLNWTRDLRDIFVKFNKCAMQVVVARSQRGDDNIEAYIELREQFDQIILMLNPNEKYHVKVVKAHVGVVNHVRERLNGRNSINKTKRSKLIKLQNVLLKSEWKRIKKETESGKILNDKQVEKIYKEFEKKAFSSEIKDDIDM